MNRAICLLCHKPLPLGDRGVCRRCDTEVAGLCGRCDRRAECAERYRASLTRLGYPPRYPPCTKIDVRLVGPRRLVDTQEVDHGLAVVGVVVALLAADTAQRDSDALDAGVVELSEHWGARRRPL